MKRLFGFMGLTAIITALCFTSCTDESDDSSSDVINLAAVTSDITVADGYTLTGTLKSNAKITIADEASVTLDGVTISSTDGSRAILNRAVDSGSCDWAGITCSGNATIILKAGTNNKVEGFSANYPGILVPKGKTLTIRGSGLLEATGGDGAAAIGGGANAEAGNILIAGGAIKATGGDGAAAIGSGKNGSVGSISIASSITDLAVTAGTDSANSIGAGNGGTCGDVTIGCTVSNDGTVTGGTKGAIISGTFSYSATMTYTVTVNTNDNGTVTADSASAGAGVEITLTETPKSGYEFVAYSVTDARGMEITVTDGKFTMPESNVMVSATFKSTATAGITVTLESVESTDADINISETEGVLSATEGFANYLWKMDGSVIQNGESNVFTPDTEHLEAGKHKITLVVTDSDENLWSATAVFTVNK